MENKYIFTSERLGFRNWMEADIPKMTEINADPKVMEFFPETQILAQTQAYVKRMQKQFSERGFCYFAVETLDSGEFIGFIGLSEQNFEADFTPCVDMGWRLSQKAWGKGFATEGAKKCLEFGFHTIGLEKIKALCPKINTKSENVMKKLGMVKVGEFNHALLTDFQDLERCMLYEIRRSL